MLHVVGWQPRWPGQMTSTVSSLSRLCFSFLALSLHSCFLLFFNLFRSHSLIDCLYKYLVDPPSFVVVPLTPSPPIPKDSFQL